MSKSMLASDQDLDYNINRRPINNIKDDTFFFNFMI
jgi:hypothetical protein